MCLPGMIIYANGAEITNAFYADQNYKRTVGGTVGVERATRDSDQRVSVSASFPSGIAITVYVGIRNLEFSMDVPPSPAGQVT